MFALKTVLVPVDFSELSNAALRYAAEMARTTGGELLLLHVVEAMIPPTAYIPLGGYVQPYHESMDMARQQMDELRPMLEGLTYRTMLRQGLPGDEIVAVAQEEKVDGVIMATHGRSGLSRLLMGSTTEAVVRNANCAVITLRGDWLLSRERSRTEAAASGT